MGRGHHRQRVGGRLGGLAAAVLLPWLAKTGLAQNTSTPASPAPTATPWVQASPPPGATPAPRPPKPPRPLPSPSASLSPEDVKREMMRHRAEEQRAQESPAAKEDKPPGKEAVRLEQLPPDEREAYQRGLPLWRQLPVEEREDIRRQADERARQDTNKAYRESGLNLDPDQREVFDLRYRQERRRLERELQEKINAERTRRLVEITGRLKQEFAVKPTPSTVVPSASPTPAPAP